MTARRLDDVHERRLIQLACVVLFMGVVVTVVEKILQSDMKSTNRLLLGAYEQVFSKVLAVSIIKNR